MLVLLAGCRRAREEVRKDPTPPAPSAPPPFDLLRRYPPPSHLHWRERSEESGKTLSLERMEETWTEVAARSPAVRAWVMTPSYPDRKKLPPMFDVFEATPPKVETRYELRPEGFVLVETKVGHQRDVCEPPYIILPTNAHVGQKFGGPHRNGSTNVVRECSVKAYPKCAHGIDVVCKSTFPNGSWLEVARQFCDGVGMVGLLRSYRNEKGVVSTTTAEDLRDDR